MSAKSLSFACERSLLAALLITCVSPCFGQAQGRLGRGADPAKTQVLAVHQQVNNTARTQALTGDLAGAEKSLDQLSTAPKGSAARHLDTAQRLTELANTLMRSAEPKAAKRAAEQALQALLIAERLAAEPSLKSAIQSQKGFLFERYLADAASAKAAYQEAASLEPGSVSAKVKLARFIETEANVRRKVNPNAR